MSLVRMIEGGPNGIKSYDKLGNMPIKIGGGKKSIAECLYKVENGNHFYSDRLTTVPNYVTGTYEKWQSQLKSQAKAKIDLTDDMITQSLLDINKQAIAEIEKNNDAIRRSKSADQSGIIDTSLFADRKIPNGEFFQLCVLADGTLQFEGFENLASEFGNISTTIQYTEKNNTHKIEMISQAIDNFNLIRTSIRRTGTFTYSFLIQNTTNKESSYVMYGGARIKDFEIGKRKDIQYALDSNFDYCGIGFDINGKVGDKMEGYIQLTETDHPVPWVSDIMPQAKVQLETSATVGGGYSFIFKGVKFNKTSGVANQLVYTCSLSTTALVERVEMENQPNRTDFANSNSASIVIFEDGTQSTFTTKDKGVTDGVINIGSRQLDRNPLSMNQILIYHADFNQQTSEQELAKNFHLKRNYE